MKPAPSVTQLAAAAAMVLLLAACSSTPVAEPAPPPVKSGMAPAPTAPAPTAAARPAPSSTVTTVTLPDYLNPNSPIATDRSVYFDFDNFSIKPNYTGLVERQGKFLASHPSVAIRVEGNADERGSAEYNLALGQKRAEALLQALKLYGVDTRQMEAISWGESKPKATGHDEAAWAMNRRADLQYPNR